MIPFILAAIGGYLIGDSIEPKKFEAGGLVAPNGKPTNLTPEQYKLVRTPEFKAWFGDWENSPETSSKVVDENGEPLVVYHGSKEKWWDNINYFVFNPQFEGKAHNVIRFDWGSIYFSSKREVAKTYGGNVLEVFLNFRNPIIFNANGDNIEDAINREVNEIGYKPQYEDDIVIKKTKDSISYPQIYSDIFITRKIFGAIKLADGTNATFDTDNPDIRYKEGGKITLNNK